MIKGSWGDLRREKLINSLAWMSINIPAILGVDRFLMLGADTLILDDIRKIYYCPTIKLVCAGMIDSTLPGQKKIIYEPIIRAHQYFMSDIVIWNCEEYIRRNIAQKTTDDLKKNTLYRLALDQESHNIVIGNKKVILPTRWGITPRTINLFQLLKVGGPGAAHLAHMLKPWKYKQSGIKFHLKRSLLISIFASIVKGNCIPYFTGRFNHYRHFLKQKGYLDIE